MGVPFGLVVGPEIETMAERLSSVRLISRVCADVPQAWSR